jgi:hypothetical protein
MFKLNLNKADRGAIMAILAIIGAIYLLTFLKSRRSGYQARPITIKPKSEKSIFDLDHKLECVAGPQKTAGYYSRSLTPGGVCGAQKVIRDHGDYEIADGIGGVLI